VGSYSNELLLMELHENESFCCLLYKVVTAVLIDYLFDALFWLSAAHF
jgi:hypothetical protein